MKIFANSICTSIPKTNIFNKPVGKSIVWKRESCIYWGWKKWYLTHTSVLAVKLVEDRNFFNISGKNLPRVEYILKFRVLLFSDLSVYLMDITLGSPWISIHYCKIHLIRVYSSLLEVGVLQILNAPWDIGSLAFLFVLSNIVNSVSHLLKWWFILFKQLFGLKITVFLPLLHTKIDQISTFSILMTG